MNKTSRSLILAASLFAIPVVGALAQGSTTNNYGANRSETAAPGTADSKAASGLSTADSQSGSAAAPSSSAKSPRVDGATGRTVVPGSNSSVASDRSATGLGKTDQATTGAGGGGK